MPITRKMTETDMQGIYKTACAAKGFTGSDAQCTLWWKILGWAQRADLEQALIWFYADSVNFPMPAELKPLVERSRLERKARAEAGRHLVRWQCTLCRITQSGWILVSDTTPRICRGIPPTGRGVCNGPMEIVYDERSRGEPQAFQQQQCPGCQGIVEMMRPVGEQFRTWCMPCQSYRKIVPKDLELTAAEWQMLCVELDAIYRDWKARGAKPNECIDPQFDRAKIRGGFSQPPLPLPSWAR